MRVFLCVCWHVYKCKCLTTLQCQLLLSGHKIEGYMCWNGCSIVFFGINRIKHEEPPEHRNGSVGFCFHASTRTHQLFPKIYHRDFAVLDCAPEMKCNETKNSTLSFSLSLSLSTCHIFVLCASFISPTVNDLTERLTRKIQETYRGRKDLLLV